MTVNIEQHILSASVAARLILMKEIQGKLDDRRTHEKMIQKRFLDAAPGQLHDFIQEEGLLETLFEFSHASVKINYGTYGFNGLDTIKSGMKELAAAWKDNVIIKFGVAEPHRVEIFFKAAT